MGLNILALHKLNQLRSEDEAQYRLHCRPNAKVTSDVDHEHYAYQLALDMKVCTWHCWRIRHDAQGFNSKCLPSSGYLGFLARISIAGFDSLGHGLWNVPKCLLCLMSFGRQSVELMICGMQLCPDIDTSLIIKVICSFQPWLWPLSAPSASCPDFPVQILLANMVS